MSSERPSTPRGPLRVTDRTRDSITISWLPPSHDGGAAISDYVIERRDIGQLGWTRIARVKPTDLSYTNNNLSEGVEYFYRIYAENIEGLSESLTSDAIIPARKLSKYQTGAAGISLSAPQWGPYSRLTTPIALTWKKMQ